MTIEGVVAVAAGVMANSIALIGFGVGAALDYGELLSRLCAWLSHHQSE